MSWVVGKRSGSLNLSICGGMWMSKLQKHPERATCMLWGRRATGWAFQDSLYGSRVANPQEPWQTDTWRVTQQGTAPGIRTGLASHTRTFVQGKGIPAQPWHHVLWLLLMKTSAKWTFRDFSEHGGYPGRACYFIVSLLWELIWFQSRAFTLLKFTVTTE